MADEQTQSEVQWRELPYMDMTTGEKGIKAVVCGYNMTDTGNAQRLIALCGQNIRYCVNEKTWYVYEELKTGGGVWAVDEKNKIYALAQDVISLIHSEVSFVEADGKKERREAQKALSKWAFASESLNHINAMVVLAQSDQRVTVTSDEFNANPWLINCLNGTLDLEARELRKPAREDLITKIVAVPYEPETKSAKWYERLLEVLSVRQGAFLQRACGSGLTAINRDKALFVLYGKPNARKSTLLDAIFKTLGSYAHPVDISTFAKTITRPGGARPDIVSLEGVRAAQCSEVPHGMIFNDAFLKAITGANPRSVRDLYEKGAHKVIPVTKFYIETNFLPRINFDDEAAFNRFFIVTFLNTIPLEDCDPKIKEFLLDDEEAQKAIFAWLVQGCYDWQDYGLMPPDSVNAARQEYQKTMNPLASFIEGECILEADIETATSELYERFKLAATPEERHNVSNAQSFGMYLTKLGFENVHKERGNVRVGIRLRGPTEFDDEVTKRVTAEDPEDYEADLLRVPCTILEYMKKLYKNPSWSSGIQKGFEDDLNEIVDEI